MARLPVEDVTLDGEAVCLLEDGRPDFHALRSRHACRDARLIAYDLLNVNGEDLRKLPLHERRTRLESLLSGNDALSFSSHARLCSGMRDHLPTLTSLPVGADAPVPALGHSLLPNLFTTVATTARR
jgi:ATP-dependent DNA ligase